MIRSIYSALFVCALVGTIPIAAEDPTTVRTHALTVEQKLELLETIEITSEKELKESNEQTDPVVETILEELAQVESESVSSE